MSNLPLDWAPLDWAPLDWAPLDWALCRSFLAIMRAGSLAGAARSLHLTHPTLRRHLDEIEAALGAALFVRSPAGLIPTALAETMRAPAEAMEAAADALVRLASAGTGTVAGTVRITASEIMGAEVLPPMLAAIRADYPGLDFELVLTNTVQDIARRDADIAVRMIRPVQPDLVARKVGVARLGIYAHDDWLAAHGMPDSIGALVAARHFVGYDRDAAPMIRAMADQGIAARPGDFCFRSDSDLAQLAAIRAGLGVGLCQVRIGDRTPHVRRILPAATFALEIWLTMHADNRRIARVRTVFDALARALALYGS